ncbi:D-alanine--D-alanine ligase [Thalassobaculum fulvum]|uniref:D-alanine--D-alanine ligase n=1 Tax=Thalassobaculum fulvum TaxID=1633335 RepID=A0A918XT52_9PROT|nr:D-alanine--D-alanine ligase [Thalassobaculum fulvum]GHD54059.1 D-alanine--D-alanine ligase [Thalassobaculum fulvum]
MNANRSETHVAVLMGGWSPEREVSLSSGRECAKALRQAGWKVSEVDVDRGIAARLTTLRPDVVFNALHGPIGEDGNIQGLLNILGIPYTHSGVRASAVAMDKPTAKDVFARHGLRCPEGRVVTLEDFDDGEPLEPPYVIKPIDQGSSVGVHIVRQGDNYRPTAADWPFGQHVLVERYVPGRELTVAVWDGEAMEVTEITSDRGFYDYEAKYAAGGSVHLLPAPVPAAIRRQAMEVAARAHQALGCRGISRADFRYDDTAGEPGELYLLEINTQPGMTPTSLVPEQAAHLGVSFPELVSRMVEDARCDE